MEIDDSIKLGLPNVTLSVVKGILQKKLEPFFFHLKRNMTCKKTFFLLWTLHFKCLTYLSLIITFIDINDIEMLISLFL